MKTYNALILGSLLAFLWGLIILGGCANRDPEKVDNSVPATGNAIQQATAHTDAAKSDVKAAIPHSDATGQSVLGLAGVELDAVLNKLGLAVVDLNQVQKERNTLEADAIHWKHKDYTDVHSHAYIIGSWIVWGSRVLLILLALHLLFGLLSLWTPPPYSTIFKIAGNIVNPLGWFTWLITKIHANRQLNAAASPPAAGG
jgi:outer membrane murein-binding lipoprotein Lpp